MRLIAFILLSACAHVSKPPPEYMAAFDVTCFLYAAERTQDKSSLTTTQARCMEAMRKYFVSAVVH